MGSAPSTLGAEESHEPGQLPPPGPRPSTSAGSILLGALNHSEWLAKVAIQPDDSAAITRRNPGFQSIIDKHSTPIKEVTERRPWNRGKSAVKSDENEVTFSVDLIAPRTKSGKTAAPKDKVRVQGSKTLMHTTISLQDIDLRAESALKKRVSTNAYQLRRTNAIVALAKSRAAQIDLKGEVNVLLISTPGVDDVRTAFGHHLDEVREHAAESGTYIRLIDPLGEEANNHDFQDMTFPHLLDCIYEADIIIGVAGPHPGPAFPSTRDQWQKDSWARAVERHPSIEKLQGKSIFEIATVIATTAHNGKRPAVPCVFCFQDVGSGDDSEDEEDVSDILEEGGEKIADCAPSPQALIDMQPALSAQLPLFHFWEAEEAADIVTQYLNKYLAAMLPKKSPMVADYGLQRAAAEQLRQNYVTGDDTADRLVSETRQIALLQGPAGAGKSTLAMVAAGRLQAQAIADEQHITVAQHMLGLSWESAQIEAMVTHLIYQLAPALVPSPTEPAPSMRTLLKLLREAIETASARGLVVVAVAGLDRIHPNEYYLGDFAEVRLVGPHVIAPNKCLYALTNIFPGESLNRQNVIIKFKEPGDVDFLSPLHYDMLVDGKGIALTKLKAQSVLTKGDIEHPALDSSDSHVTQSAFGLLLAQIEREYSRKTQIVVDGLVTGGVAAAAGLRTGEVILSVNGVSLQNKSLAEAYRIFVRSDVHHLTMETASSGRRHTSGCDWLSAFADAPTQCRVILTSSSAETSQDVRKLFDEKTCAVIPVDGLKSGAIEKLVVSRSALNKREQTSSLIVQSIFSESQKKVLTEGRCALTKDLDGKAIQIIFEAGIADANGWYRREPSDDPGVVLRYSRNVPASEQKIHDSITPGSRKTLVPERTGVVTKYCMDRLAGGKGWVLRSNLEVLYHCKMDTMDPPTVAWNLENNAVKGPPPSVLNLDKTAQSRPPPLVIRAALAGLVKPSQSLPQVALVEGARPNDINGWYIADTQLDSQGAIVYNMTTSSSGKHYRLYSQSGRWFLAEVDPASGNITHNIFRNSNQGRESLVPPVDDWSAISSAAPEIHHAAPGQARVSLAHDIEDKLIAQAKAAPAKPKAHKKLSLRTLNARLRMAMMTGRSVPTVRCMNPPVQLPLFVRLCVDQLKMHWNFFQRPSIVLNAPSNFDITNLVHMQLTLAENIAKSAFRPSFIRSVLLLIYFSRVGMKDDELAEICNIESGVKSTPWMSLFSLVSPMLVSYGGRWSFRDPAIRELVGKRYTHPLIRWCHASTQYSFFERMRVCSDCPPRALEELSNVDRFDPEVFERSKRLEATSNLEVDAIGWAMTYNQTLTKLDLSKNNITDRAVISLAAGLGNNTVLQELSLEGNAVDVEGAQGLADGLAQNTSLQVLDLNGNRVKAVGAIAIGKALRDNHSLRVLLLSGNQIMCAGAAGLASMIAVNDTLVEVGLADNCISTEGAAALGQAVGTNMTLLRLNLRGNFFGSDGANEFSMGMKGSICRLSKLNLGMNGIESPGLEHLSKMLRDNAYLVSLSLAGNRIDDKGIPFFRQSLISTEVYRANRKLARLNLSGNKISTDGGKLLFQIIQMSKCLTDVPLDGNRIDEPLYKTMQEWIRVNRKISRAVAPLKDSR